MGQLTSDGVAIIVPVYLACAAILLFLAVTAAIVAVRRGHFALFGGFAAWSLAASLVAFATAAFYQSESMAGGMRALAWQGHAEALFLAASLAFVAAFSEVPRRGAWAVAAAAALAVALALQGTAPAAARFAVAKSSGWTLFSWGEFLFYIQGSAGGWMWIFYLSALALLAWSAWRALVLWHWGAKRSATFLAVTVALLGAAFLHGMLIDFAGVRSFQTLTLAALCAGALMALRLTERLHEFRDERARSPADIQRDTETLREADLARRVLAFSDPVTGLPNRMFVHDHLTTLIDHGPPLSHGAVLLCVLAHYEATDRALTQAFADELMREVTVRLATIARGRAVIARTSGDSFTAVLEGYASDEDGAAGNVQALAGDMILSLSRPVRVGDYALNVVARFGMATFETGVSSPTEVLARAEKALESTRAIRNAHSQALLRIAPLETRPDSLAS